MDFLGMGWPEILTIAVVAVIVVGPERLPEYMRKIGKGYRKIKKMTTGVTRDFKSAINLDEDGSLESIKASLEDDAEELRRSLDVDLEDVADSVNESADSLNDSLSEAADTVNDSLGDIDDIDLSSLEVKEPEPVEEVPPPPAPDVDIMGMPIDPVQDSSND